MGGEKRGERRMEKNMAHMRKNHSSSASLLAYETVLLWRENSGWDLRHFSCLQYILGRNSVIWLVKYSTELKLIKGNNKKELKKKYEEKRMQAYSISLYMEYHIFHI